MNNYSRIIIFSQCSNATWNYFPNQLESFSQLFLSQYCEAVNLPVLISWKEPGAFPQESSTTNLVFFFFLGWVNVLTVSGETLATINMKRVLRSPPTERRKANLHFFIKVWILRGTRSFEEMNLHLSKIGRLAWIGRSLVFFLFFFRLSDWCQSKWPFKGGKC